MIDDSVAGDDVAAEHAFELGAGISAMRARGNQNGDILRVDSGHLHYECD